uniref:TerD domain-containing protein n=1 Tax=Mesocestoides corti TaxID=53468 RepID=A0A5K3EZE8_MESCO
VATSKDADILDHTCFNQSTISFAFQWHVRKISSQPETDTYEKRYVMSGAASVGDSYGRCLIVNFLIDSTSNRI